jgi:hypothetical protein
MERQVVGVMSKVNTHKLSDDVSEAVPLIDQLARPHKGYVQNGLYTARYGTATASP